MTVTRKTATKSTVRNSSVTSCRKPISANALLELLVARQVAWTNRIEAATHSAALGCLLFNYVCVPLGTLFLDY